MRKKRSSGSPAKKDPSTSFEAVEKLVRSAAQPQQGKERFYLRGERLRPIYAAIEEARRKRTSSETVPRTRAKAARPPAHTLTVVDDADEATIWRTLDTVVEDMRTEAEENPIAAFSHAVTAFEMLLAKHDLTYPMIRTFMQRVTDIANQTLEVSRETTMKSKPGGK